MKNLSAKSILSLLIFILSFTAAAAEDSDYVQVARERLYVGGLDESDLKVQQQLLSVDQAGRASSNEAGNDTNSESTEGF